MISIFRQFRRLLDIIQALVDSIERLARVQEELGPALDRLNSLELSRHQFEAECEGMLLKADGKLRAANSSEQRERQLKKTNDKHALDPFDPDGDPGPEQGYPVLKNDAPAGEGEGVPPMRLALATNDKAYAQRAKWGVR